MEFQGQRYSIWIEAEAWAPGQWTPADANSDAIVTFESGERWVATFFSYGNILSLAEKSRHGGERLRGAYFVATDMILVDEVTRPRLEEVVADLLAEDDFSTYFTRCPADVDTPASDAPVYLGTLDDLLGRLDDERATEQLGVLGSMLGRVGYRLMSGQAPAFHELWAAPVERSASLVRPSEPIAPDPRPWKDEAPTEFERRFLAWLHVSFGIIPSPRQGTNAEWWTIEYNNAPVGFVIAGQQKNTARQPASGIRWLLRVEEREGSGFIDIVERHFRPGSGVRRRMSTGTIRVQFKSSDLEFPFDDQEDRT
jgi:hypothetical protein